MADWLKERLKKAEKLVAGGTTPQDAFDMLSNEVPSNDANGRYARRAIARKIRFTPTPETKKKLNGYRLIIIAFLFLSAIVVLFNKQNRLEVFSAFAFHSPVAFGTFLLSNAYFWIYLFCAFAMFRWRLRIIRTTIFFAVLDFFRLCVLFPTFYANEPFIASIRWCFVLNLLIFSILLLRKAQNRYRFEAATNGYHFQVSTPKSTVDGQ